jgi:hypothetical protein
MSDDKIFCDGLIAKKPNGRAPEFIKATLSIKVAEFIPFLETHAKEDGWVNITVKESRGGKFYAELDTYVRGEKRETAETPAPPNDINPDDIPF